MSTSYSSPFSGPQIRPITAFQYRDTSAPPPLPHVKRSAPAEPANPEVAMTEKALAELLAAARAEAAAAAEARLREEYELRAAAEAAKIATAVEQFGKESKAYYARVESEVVRLALSIAAKILHREAQVDPLLVAALVQVAVNQLKENSAVTIRVHRDAAARWRAYFAAAQQWARVTITEDADLDAGGCVLETELGTANFSLAAQLKEVEQGFFDLLAQKPRS